MPTVSFATRTRTSSGRSWTRRSTVYWPRWMGPRSEEPAVAGPTVVTPSFEPGAAVRPTHCYRMSGEVSGTGDVATLMIPLPAGERVRAPRWKQGFELIVGGGGQLSECVA